VYSAVDALSPQLCGDYGGLAPNTDRLLRTVLMFVNDAAAPRFIEQISFGTNFTVTVNQNEIICQDPIHHGCIIGFDGGLVLGVQHRYGLLVVGRSRRHRIDGEACKDRHCTGTPQTHFHWFLLRRRVYYRHAFISTLPGARNIDPTAYSESDLPTDKNSALVFYCSNPFYRKAPNAARRAKGMGFHSVLVMSAGINGWLDAKLPTESDE
jgi:rhodanese-related sulfurtransferase